MWRTMRFGFLQDMLRTGLGGSALNHHIGSRRGKRWSRSVDFVPEEW
jgi:hypothetical protein